MAGAQTKISAGHVQVNGTSLYYEKYGKGKPLLLLHGWTQTSAFWQPFIRRYADAFQVYTVDLRGHGKSDPLSDDFSIRNVALDIVQLIRQLKLSDVHAIGFSYGGLVLLELENSHPHLVQQMVLVGTTNQYDGKESQKGKPAFTYENLDPAFRTYLKSQHSHGESQIKALFNPDLTYQIDIKPDELKRFKSKVLIVNGDKDEFAGIAGAVQMHTYIPNASLWIVPQSGHVAIGQANLDAFVKATKAFFASHSATL
jgi:pimeloyl-ACP methyl ester carboxylesterase